MPREFVDVDIRRGGGGRFRQHFRTPYQVWPASGIEQCAFEI